MWKTLILFLVFHIALSSISDPTVSEIRQAYEVSPDPEWGSHARKQNSLRILCIGGSNTAIGEDRIDSYVSVLNKHLKNGSVLLDEHFMSQSFALNRGASGSCIDNFTGMKFDFEMSENTSSWPNLIIVDAAVNLPLHVTNTTILLMLERYLRSTLLKYSLRNVSQPDFLFYNMPHLERIFRLSPAPQTQQERLDYVNSYPSQPLSFVWDDIIRQFASYYHIPVISWGNATFAAAMRHFVNSSFDVTPWAYSEDGTHMSRPVGVDFGVNQLLLPFLRTAMQQRHTTVYKTDKMDLNKIPRLFPPGPEQWRLISYESSPCEECDDLYHPKLAEIMHNVDQNSAWNEVVMYHGQTCFGSTVEYGVGELRFHVPGECREGHLNCRVQMTFLHSWNSSYVGHASCALHRHYHSQHNGTLLASVVINGQEGVDGHTIPIKSLFPANVTFGQHSVKCKNLVKDRLSCMTGLEINAIIIV